MILSFIALLPLILLECSITLAKPFSAIVGQDDPFSGTPISVIKSPLALAEILTPMPDVWTEIVRNSPTHQMLTVVNSSSFGSEASQAVQTAVSSAVSDDINQVVAALVLFLDTKVVFATDRFIDEVVLIFFHKEVPPLLTTFLKELIHVLEHKIIESATNVLKNDIGHEWEKVKEERDRRQGNSTVPGGNGTTPATPNTKPSDWMKDLSKQIVSDLKIMVQQEAIQWVRNSLGKILDLIHDALQNKILNIGEKAVAGLPPLSTESVQATAYKVTSVNEEASEPQAADVAHMALQLIHVQLNETKNVLQSDNNAQSLMDFIMSSQEAGMVESQFEFMFDERRKRRDSNTMMVTSRSWSLKRPLISAFKWIAKMLAFPVFSTLLIMSIFKHGLESVFSRDWERLLFEAN